MTSSEVELMETILAWVDVAQTKSPMTSSEVELMETDYRLTLQLWPKSQ